MYFRAKHYLVLNQQSLGHAQLPVESPQLESLSAAVLLAERDLAYLST